jgi:hypothetical protein
MPSGLDRKRINAAVPTPVNPHSSVPIKGDHLSDKDAAQSQSVGACRNQKRRATFLRTCSSDGSAASCRGMDTVFVARRSGGLIMWWHSFGAVVWTDFLNVP